LTPLLKKSGGRVINVSTELSASNYVEDDPNASYPLFPIYKGSKQALNNWSRKAAVDLKGEGISLNVVNPGWVETSMGGGGAIDTILDGIQATLYLSTTKNSHHGDFLQQYKEEKPPAGMVQICTRSW